jgi:hypothetical protein
MGTITMRSDSYSEYPIRIGACRRNLSTMKSEGFEGAPSKVIFRLGAGALGQVLGLLTHSLPESGLLNRRAELCALARDR